jgi:hypothetical protein
MSNVEEKDTIWDESRLDHIFEEVEVLNEISSYQLWPISDISLIQFVYKSWNSSFTQKWKENGNDDQEKEDSTHYCYFSLCECFMIVEACHDCHCSWDYTNVKK